MEDVSSTAMLALRSRGIPANVEQAGDQMRVAWRTADGGHASVVFTRTVGAKGEVTRAHLDVDKGGDPQTGLQVLAYVEEKHGRAQ